ncbi:hypothetical protein JTB14_020408 [Gonioctena quinquepunctata]|nr:hypothetical protein JTB14_020408 [Gonioctena quinquepunctata]
MENEREADSVDPVVDTKKQRENGSRGRSPKKSITSEGKTKNEIKVEETKAIPDSQIPRIAELSSSKSTKDPVRERRRKNSAKRRKDVTPKRDSSSMEIEPALRYLFYS